MRQHGWFRPHVRGLTAISSTTLREGGGWWIPGSQLDLDFANNRAFNRSTGFNGSPNGILTYTSPSPKLVYGDDGVLGYAPHNLFLNSGAPATQNVTLITGFSYTVTVTGSGSLAGSSGASGTASAGSPATFVATGTTGTFTLTGSLTTIQINLGSSALTYIPTTSAAAYSLPIDHDPTTFAPLGVLIEEQRVNLLTYSEQFDNAAWGKTADGDVGVTANATVAPDGTTTADLVWAAAATGYHSIRQGVTVAGAVQSWSVYAKPQNYNKVGIREDFAVGQFATFLLSGSGSVIDKTGGTTATITALVNGWYRITFTNSSTSANMGIGIYIMDASYTTGDPASYNYTGNDADGVYLWGAQQEAGAFPTSYIPTVASQVTRAADQVSILTSAFGYNASEGSLVTEADTNQMSGSLYSYVASFGDGTANERMVSRSLNTTFNFAVVDGGVTQASNNLSPVALSTMYKAAFAYKQNDFAVTLDGGVVGTDVSGTVPTVTTLKLGADSAAGATLNGHIKRLTYFPTRKTNAELQALSA